MRFIDYFKDKVVFILINIGILIFSSILIKVLGLSTYTCIFIVILNFLGSSIFYIYDFFNKKQYYNELLKDLDNLDKKYLITDVINEGSFIESRILYNILKVTDKSMNDEIAKLSINTKEYKEYIEMWVHEIKTPIAASKLLLDNNPSEFSSSLVEETNKVDNYIEQVLFYARSNNPEKDYLIKEINIRECINSTIKKNANILIQKSVRVKIDNAEKWVYSDTKWVEFILNQIISNSIKYMDKEIKILEIRCEEVGSNIVLEVMDNGIGMSEISVIRAFDKGYTGENGRVYGKSTGLGLYLCKKLCIKLGLNIKIDSEVGGGTKVSLLFPRDRMMMFN